MVEEWRDVSEYPERYEVSSHGRVRNKKTGRVLKLQSNHDHLQVQLSKYGAPISRLVHRLVALAFLPRPALEGLEVRHLDGNGSNNAVSNLQWGTHSENELDKVRHGTHHEAAKTRCKSGHEFSAGNTRSDPKRGRVCIACERRTKQCDTCGGTFDKRNLARHKRVNHPLEDRKR